MDNTQNQNNPQTPYGSPAPQPDYGFMDQYAVPPPKKSKKPLIIAVVLVFLGVGLGALLLVSGDKQPSQQKNVASQNTLTPSSGGSLFGVSVFCEATFFC